ncbi:MAG: glycosyltransferase family 2 protein [Candidatus Omnitrophica bacterium]|nr:glycosyltransferase family 2 protein [Candidatus Omnitrophota bacterium]
MNNNLTVIVITKNEEKNIRRCLDSIKDISDEIIIVDDNSMDRTVEIAQKEYNAKVISNPLNNDFANQRNLGIEHATCDWIFQMDADEVVPKETSQKIIKAIHNNKDYAAFNIIRRDCIYNIPLMHVPFASLARIFKKGEAQYSGKVHEQLVIKGKSLSLDAIVLHYNIFSIEQMMQKALKYSTLEADKIIENTPDISIKKVRYKISFGTIKLFLKHYFKRNSRKDGEVGFIYAVINSISPAILWLKVLEKLILRDRGKGENYLEARSQKPEARG